MNREKDLNGKAVRGVILFLILNLLYSNAIAFQVSKSSMGAELKWGSSSVTYLINTSGGPTGSLSALLSAGQTWNDVPTSDFVFIYGGNTDSTAWGVNDGQNIIMFGPIEDEGVLARNDRWYYVPTGEIVDSDIRVNNNFSWSNDGSAWAFDVQSVVTHELGHSLSLDHVPYVQAIMYPTFEIGQIKRNLHQDDINGITYLYPNGAMAVPTGQSWFIYDPVAFPVLNMSSDYALPVAFGDLISNLNLQIALPGFFGPVDIYFAYYAPAVDPDNLCFITESSGTIVVPLYGFSLDSLNANLRFRSGLTQPLIWDTGNISLQALPPGDYRAYIGIMPHDKLSDYYIWDTGFSLP